jgi:hypothetical protein
MAQTNEQRLLCVKGALELSDSEIEQLENFQSSLSGDPELTQQLILATLMNLNTGGTPSADLTRVTAAKSSDYTIAAGFTHCLVYLPEGVSATVDGIPLEGKASWILPSSYPALHDTPVAITSISGGSVYVSETRP